MLRSIRLSHNGTVYELSRWLTRSRVLVLLTRVATRNACETSRNTSAEIRID